MLMQHVLWVLTILEEHWVLLQGDVGERVCVSPLEGPTVVPPAHPGVAGGEGYLHCLPTGEDGGHQQAIAQEVVVCGGLEVVNYLHHKHVQRMSKQPIHTYNMIQMVLGSIWK